MISLYTNVTFFYFSKIDEYASEASAREWARKARTNALAIKKSQAVLIFIRPHDDL